MYRKLKKHKIPDPPTLPTSCSFVKTRLTDTIRDLVTIKIQNMDINPWAFCHAHKYLHLDLFY